MTIHPILEEFSSLHARVQDFKPTMARYEELRKQLASIADEQFPNKPAKLESSTAFVEFTAPTQTRVIQPEATPSVYSLLGEPTFLKVAKVSVGAIEPLLSATQLASVVTLEAGPRRLKTTGRVQVPMFGNLHPTLAAALRSVAAH